LSKNFQMHEKIYSIFVIENERNFSVKIKSMKNDIVEGAMSCVGSVLFELLIAEAAVCFVAIAIST
jgi:hypothetical protein